MTKQEDLFKSTAIPMPWIPEGSRSAVHNTSDPSQHATNTSQSTVIVLPELIENTDTTSLTKNMEFSDKTIRNGFIRKVYGIVLTQLALTALIVFSFVKISVLKPFLMQNAHIILYSSLGVYFSTFFCIFCCEGPRRRVPYNFIFLFLFTVSTATMMGLVAFRFKFEELLLAAGATIAIFLALTLFACQTKIDFTMLTGSGVSILLALLLLGTGMLFTGYDKMRLLYSAIGVVIISIYIVYDTQMIVGGEHRYGFSSEEYVFAALILYLDVVILFLRILRCFRY